MVRNIKLTQLIGSTSPFIEPPFPEKMTWTASSVKSFRACKRLFFWKYIYRLSPRYKETALRIGSIFHETLGQWYKGDRSSIGAIAKKKIDPAVAEIEQCAAMFNQEDYDDLMADMAMLQGMLEGYGRVYKRDRAKWHIVRGSIEQQFQVDMGDFWFEGKVDLCAWLKSKSSPFLVEHKTASRIDSNYIDRLALDTQSRGYIFGAIHGLGIPVKEVLYDVVRKSKLRRKAGESAKQYNERIAEDYELRPDFYFYREPLKFSARDIDAFEFEIRQTHAEFIHLLQQIKDSGASVYDPRQWGINDQSCTMYHRLCQFHKVCTGCLDVQTALLFQQRESLHAELEGE